jgi:tetratricopeptide (TPR) repeat protein
MKIDSVRTKTSLWYATYLMTIGRIDEGLEVVKSKAGDYPGSFEIRLVYALFLYAARSYENARNMLYQVDGLELGGDLKKLLENLINIATGDSIETVPVQLKWLAAEIDQQWNYPTSSLTTRTDIKHAVEREGFRTTKGLRLLKARDDSDNRFAGLIVLSLVGAGRLQEAKEKMAALRRQRSMKSIQLALAYIGLGNQARALASLRRACKEQDIFINWLHLLPLFDPLRNHPRFQEIIEIIAADDVESE